ALPRQRAVLLFRALARAALCLLRHRRARRRRLLGRGADCARDHARDADARSFAACARPAGATRAESREKRMTIAASPGANTLFDRFTKLNWGVITILIALAFVGVLMHFSVSSGAWTDMPLTHGIRFVLLLVAMVLAAMFLDAR